MKNFHKLYKFLFFLFIFWELFRILTLMKTFMADFTDTFLIPLREKKILNNSVFPEKENKRNKTKTENQNQNQTKPAQF